MTNPLNKRFKRQLIEDASKYIVIFLMLVLTISAISGFEAACDSTMRQIYIDKEVLNQQDGNFVVKKKLNKAQILRIENEDLTLYEEFYKSLNLDNGLTLWVYKTRSEIDRGSLFEGHWPQNANEIAIERLSGENNNYHIGSTLSYGGNEYTVCGLISLVDYSCLFEKESDMMFNAITFSVGVLNEEGFNRLDNGLINYRYAYSYHFDVNEDNQKQLADDLKEVLIDNTNLESFTPAYLSRSINFVLEDGEGDSAMMYIFLYIMIALMAFIFCVNINNTIAKESLVIGTLKASGYTDQELIKHYMLLPAIVSLISSIVGNVLGYTIMEDIFSGIYKLNYSLSPYVSHFKWDSFIKVTIVPVVMMLVIDYVVLSHTLKLSPLKFMRHDLSRKRKKRALGLNHHLPFFTRFRLRILFQNKSAYLTLFCGILLANLLLFFGLGLPDILTNYSDYVKKDILAPYQTILSMPISLQSKTHKLEASIDMLDFVNKVETKNETAEKFTYISLKSVENLNYMTDDVGVYGLKDNSQYFDKNLNKNDCYITQAYVNKYHHGIGDIIELLDKENDRSYVFRITGIVNQESALSIYMNQQTVNDIFDLGDDTFVGYLSKTPIDDVDASYIGQVITSDTMSMITTQLMSSMGGMMNIFSYFSIVLFVIIVYLLSKTIIERNTQSISMTKILGYSTYEISKLYIIATFVVVVIAAFVSLPICYGPTIKVFELMMYEMMQGYIPFIVSSSISAKIVAMNLITYIFVALLETRKIMSIRMDEALKSVE